MNYLFNKSLLFAVITLGLVGSSYAQTNIAQRFGQVIGAWEGASEGLSMVETAQRSEYWQGRMSGQVNGNGRLTLTTENGCQIQATLVPIGNAFQGNARVSGCQDPDFNRSYLVNSHHQDGELILSLSSVAVDRKTAVEDSWQLTAVLSRVQ